MVGVSLTGINTLKNVSENPGVVALVVAGTAVEALEEEGTEVLLEKEVLSEGPKLSNGTGKGNRPKLLEGTTNTLKMACRIMTILIRIKKID